MFYSLISILWANDILGYFQYNYYLIIFTYSILIIVLFFNSEKKIVLLLNIWSVIFVSQIIFSIFEILFDVRTLNSRYYNSELLFSYPTGFFGNENEYALFIVISMPILLFSYKILAIKFNKYIEQSTFFLIFVISIFVLFETHSRTSLIAFILIFMIFLFLNHFKFFIMLFIPFLLYFVINFEDLNYRIDESVIVRINMIYSSINAMIDTNFIGVGAGNMGEYVISNNLKIYEITAIHNWFFEVLGNYGLLIFILYMMFTLSILIDLFLIYKKNIKNINIKYLACSLFLSNIAFLFGYATLSSAYSFIPYWLLLGITIAFININRQNKG